MFTGRFDGSVAVVTGAAGGMGRAIARAFLAEGATVVGVDSDPDLLEEARAEMHRSHAASFITVGADVTEADAVRRAMDDILQAHGRIDVLVNAAGISTMHVVAEMEEAEWDRVLDVNAKGTFLTTRAALPGMIVRHAGVIVNIASAAGRRGVRLLGHYAASKFAVIGLTQSVALETAAVGVRVNAVCPGLITTQMQAREVAWEARLRGVSEASILERYVASVPMGRLGTPEDVAPVVLFLASDAARYVTGQSINIDGGYVLS